MGLSEHERITSLYASVEYCTGLRDCYNNIQNPLDPEKRIKSLLDSLWHAFFAIDSIKYEGNPSSIRYRDYSPWGMAITNVCHETRYTNLSYQDHDFISDRFEIRQLLQLRESFIFKTYEGVTNVRWILTRYGIKDSLAQSYSELLKIVSEIMGICYAEFSNNKDYATAYMKHKILMLIYLEDHKQDNISGVLIKENIHHQLIQNLNVPLNYLQEIHIDLVKARETNEAEFKKKRALTAFTFAGNVKYKKKFILDSLKDEQFLEELENVINCSYERNPSKPYVPSKMEKIPDLGVYGYDIPQIMDQINEKTS